MVEALAVLEYLPGFNEAVLTRDSHVLNLCVTKKPVTYVLVVLLGKLLASRDEVMEGKGMGVILTEVSWISRRSRHTARVSILARIIQPRV